MNFFFRSTLQATALTVLIPMIGMGESRSVIAEESLHAVTFDEALRDCRMKQPGRINRRLSLRADSPKIAACLRRSGWANNDDVQTLEVGLLQHPSTAI